MLDSVQWRTGPAGVWLAHAIYFKTLLESSHVLFGCHGSTWGEKMRMVQKLSAGVVAKRMAYPGNHRI